MDSKIIAVFGGSFNPPAISHINLAKQILEKKKEIEKVIFVPVSTKYNKAGLAPDEIRFDLLKKVCNQYSNMEVSNIEMVTSRQLYTVETLEIIQKMYPERLIYFVLGTDNLKKLKTWHDTDKLLEQFHVLVLERDKDSMEKIIEESDFLKSHKKSFVKLNNISRIDLSSSIIRKKIFNNEDITGLVPEIIKDQIIMTYKNMTI